VLTRGAGNATTPFEGQKAHTYDLFDTCKPVSLSASPAGTASIGTIVHISGSAPCVGGATPELRFSYRLSGAPAFSILQDYSSDSTFDWNTLNLSTGTYQLKVEARAPGAPSAQSNKTGSFTLVPHNCPPGYQPDGSGGCGVTPSFALVGDTTSNYAISADGTVFGGQIQASPVSEAARGTLATGLVGIGRLQVSDNFSIVRGLSGDGATAVGYSSGAGTEAFRWSQGTGMVGLGVFAGGVSSTAWDISDDGTVICGSSEIPAATGRDKAFRWTLATGLVGLGTADPGYPGSIARGTSADGSVIVGSASTAEPNPLDLRPFRWTAASGIALLPLPASATSGAAFGISADGQVVVGEVVIAGVKQGYRWSEATGPVAVSNAAGTSLSFFTSTNADGSLAVGEGNLVSGSGAVIWDANSGSRLLQDALNSAGVVVPVGWTLTRASAISNDGHTIVGSAADAQNSSRAFVVRL
jgi:probable HAF family extracellular repeat protein